MRRLILYLILLTALVFCQSACRRPQPPPDKGPLVIRGQQQNVFFYPAPSESENAPKVLFLCGDGGWEGFALDIAAEMSSAGYDVYGFDTKRYLFTFTTDEGALKEGDVQGDLAQAARWMITRPGERVTLVGWSEGAGVAVLAAASPENKTVFSGVVTFGLSDVAVLGWRLRDDATYITHKDPDEPIFHAIKYLGEVAPLPFFMIQSSTDQFVSKSEAETLFAAAQEPKQYNVVEAQDHGFSGNHEGLFEALREALAWITQTPR